jgi:hypothetical protein
MLNFDYMKNSILHLLILLTLTCPSFAEDDRVAGQEQQLPATVAALPSNIKATPEFKAIQTQVMSNPDVLNDIQKLLSDPEVMSILSDPGFLAAVQSGNTASLGSDPRLQRLSENPKIQALIQRIKAQQ